MGEFVADFDTERVLTVPATEIAREHSGTPLPNAGPARRLRGAQRPGLDRVGRRGDSRPISGKLGEGNVAAAEAAFDYVRARTGDRAHA